MNKTNHQNGAKKAWKTIRENKQKLSDRAKKAWVTRRLNIQ
jgi:hypothetical protein